MPAMRSHLRHPGSSVGVPGAAVERSDDGAEGCRVGAKARGSEKEFGAAVDHAGLRNLRPHADDPRGGSRLRLVPVSEVSVQEISREAGEGIARIR